MEHKVRIPDYLHIYCYTKCFIFHCEKKMSRTSCHSYQFAASKKGHLGGVGVQADLVLAWCMGSEGEPSI